MAGRDGAAHDHVPRIVDHGRSRVTDECDPRTPTQTREHLVGTRRFVVVVVTRDRCRLQIDAGCKTAQTPRVLGEHEIDAFEHMPRTRREIVVVADRERDDEQHAVGRRPDRAHVHCELGVGRAEVGDERAVDVGRALRGVVGEGAASEPWTSPHHERIVAEEERADGRGEPVGEATGLQCHFDLTPER